MKASYNVDTAPWAIGYVCTFFVDGFINYDVPGSDNTGCKIYDSREKAEAAGKRYLKRMQKNGFEV